MNDILAKPFTKNGLFGILDKHLMHLKQIQLNAEIPRSVGMPPLSDQGVLDALNSSAQLVQMQPGLAQGLGQGVGQGMGQGMGAMWGGVGDEVRNPLAGMGWSDDTYQIILAVSVGKGGVVRPLCAVLEVRVGMELMVQQFLQTGVMPEVSNIQFAPTNGHGVMIGGAGAGTGTGTGPGASLTPLDAGGAGAVGAGAGAAAGGAIGTNLVFANTNRKRSVEEEDWSPTPGTVGESPAQHLSVGAGQGQGAVPAAAATAASASASVPESAGKGNKKAKR
jgi:osomolarity two-component system response regulator SKN7